MRMAETPDIAYAGMDFTWNSFKQDEYQGQSIASDAVLGFYHRPDLWTYDPGSGWVWPDFNQPGRQDRRDWFGNHDMSYNVLFTRYCQILCFEFLIQAASFFTPSTNRTPSMTSRMISDPFNTRQRLAAL
jgi:hypothetical protein